MTASRANTLRDLRDELQQALVEDSAPDTALPNEPEDPVARLFTPEAMSEVNAWRAGGPAPSSAKGLEIMLAYLWLEENV